MKVCYKTPVTRDLQCSWAISFHWHHQKAQGFPIVYSIIFYGMKPSEQNQMRKILFFAFIFFQNTPQVSTVMNFFFSIVHEDNLRRARF